MSKTSSKTSSKASSKASSKTFAKLALGTVILVGAMGAEQIANGGAAVAAGGAGAGHQSARQHWSFAGILGKFDKAQLKRGYQIYKDNCAACHGLKRIRFRNLVEAGGPGFPEDAVKVLAATFEVRDGPNEDGEMYNRPARLADAIVSPFPNDNAARAANGGALPPDLSLITRARDVHDDIPFYMVPWRFVKNVALGYQEGGADYLYALLTQYKETAPAGVTMTEGMYYNGAFPGRQIAMPPPLSAEDPFKYQDGSGTLEQNAADITAFLAWSANPELEERKSIGLRVMIYMLILTLLLYLAKRRVFARVKH